MTTWSACWRSFTALTCGWSRRPGPGGVGTPRRPRAAAAALDPAFPHGVFFLALAAVRDADVMWKTLADDLDVEGDGPTVVLEYLRNRRMLLVLDNLEQLDGAGEI